MSVEIVNHLRTFQEKTSTPLSFFSNVIAWAYEASKNTQEM